MKLLHVTDLHANRSWFRWVADHAEEYDLVAYTGDFLDIFEADSLGTQVRGITAWARTLPGPLLWCPGNHDVESTAVPVSSGRWMGALPGAKAFSTSGHLDRLGQSFVRVGWRDATPRLRALDIILAHAPPAGCFTATTNGGVADNGDLDLGDALRSAAAAPWLVLSGHIHHPARWKDRCGGTITLNSGMGANTAVPNHIEVDTTTRKARWFGDGELADVVDL